MRKAAGNQQILVRLPVEARTALQRDAKKRRCTLQAVLLEIIAKHYDLSIEPPKRGARKKPETKNGATKHDANG